MEVDSIHSCTERKMKNRKINLPSDYLTTTENVRKHSELYEAMKLETDFFKDCSNVANFQYAKKIHQILLLQISLL